MANSELLSYVKQVMDLETSVYTNQRLEDGWINSLEECGAKLPNKPKKPKKETVPIPPFKPTTPTLDKKPMLTTVIECGFGILLRFLYKGIIIKHNKTEPTYTKTSLFLCEKRRFLWPGLRKEW